MDRFMLQKNDGTFIVSQCKSCKFNKGNGKCEKNAKTVDILKNNDTCLFYKETESSND